MAGTDRKKARRFAHERMEAPHPTLPEQFFPGNREVLVSNTSRKPVVSADHRHRSLALFEVAHFSFTLPLGDRTPLVRAVLRDFETNVGQDLSWQSRKRFSLIARTGPGLR
jgi:hypothetical protein